MNLKLNDIVIDSDGSACEVLKFTKSSVELQHVKKSKDGIDCTNWHNLDGTFLRRFKIGLEGYMDFLNDKSINTKKLEFYFSTKKKLQLIKETKIKNSKINR